MLALETGAEMATADTPAGAGIPRPGSRASKDSDAASAVATSLCSWSDCGAAGSNGAGAGAGTGAGADITHAGGDFLPDRLEKVLNILNAPAHGHSLHLDLDKGQGQGTTPASLSAATTAILSVDKRSMIRVTLHSTESGLESESES